METTTTPFDLNRAIQEWRESLDQSPAFRPENLDELETHLRDSVANWQQRRLTEEEAFLIAIRRVGSGGALGVEFGRINSQNVWLDRALWMLVGVQAFSCIRSLQYAITQATTVFRYSNPLDYFKPSIYTTSFYAIVHLLIFALALVVGWRLLWRKGSSVTAWMHKVPGNLSRRLELFGACLAILLLPPLIYMGSAIFVMRFYHFGSVSSPPGAYYGTTIASLMEDGALIVLTLLLARRQLLAKT